MNRSNPKCLKMVPKLITPEEKESRMNICADILNNIDTAKATEILNQLTEADFQHCFQQYAIVWSGIEIAKSTLKAKKLLL
ncbi:hypothetical protein NQ318_003069 [Aromia moschata]|uniref:Uncharacterized protein n=1 Tax=Aromia moschata TaxID=1265417 RepID=A0AAV8Y4J8_9CUCU|nr:hypothetical protein NQ318_003069 [Aromia moschata]